MRYYLIKQYKFDIILIQEPLYSIIWSISSSSSEKGKEIIGTPHYTSYYPSWVIFSRQLINDNDHPRVITYINARLSQLCFLLRKNIINYRNINFVSFFNYGIICFIINIYSNNQQTILKYLKNIEVNLNNILIMIEDFNIKNNN